MPTSAKDRSAAVVLQRWLDFQNALSDKGTYPVQQFKLFVEAARLYIDLSQGDLIHFTVAEAIIIMGWPDFLR